MEDTAAAHLARADALLLEALDELEEAARALTRNPARRHLAADVQRRRRALGVALDRRRPLRPRRFGVV